MLKNVETIIYMEDYQVQEILEVKGYDVEKHDFIYVPIYKNPNPRYATHTVKNATPVEKPGSVKKEKGDGMLDASDIPDFSAAFTA